MLHDAIRHYHDLLTDAVAADSQAHLDEVQRRRGLMFGDRPLCTVLRPRFLTPGQYRFLQDRIAILLRAFDKAHQRALVDPAFRAQFGLSEAEEELVRFDHGFREASPHSRFDAFYVSDDELKFTEYNAETPAAPTYNDALSELFLSMPIMGQFQRRYRVIPLPARPGVLHVLLNAFHEWRGTREKPRIAIVDWREVPTYSEFVLFDDYFRSQGLESRIVDPRDVEYHNGRLMAGDYHISLIYKRVLINELLEGGGINHPIIRAVRDRAVCMVNPFRCKILYKKASFAVVTDECNAGLFSADEQAAVSAHIPWTRRVEERRTRLAGQPIDLIPHILHNREQFVLKPNDDYGGKGIVLGWTVSASEWEQAVTAALAEPYVVQQRINLPSEPFPSLIDGKVQVYERMLDTAPYVCHGEYMDACLTRISTAALLNVTAGGGSTVPTFVVEER
jgi:hypothetical protein